VALAPWGLFVPHHSQKEEELEKEELGHVNIPSRREQSWCLQVSAQPVTM
jgi:hypothetical protein